LGVVAAWTSVANAVRFCTVTALVLAHAVRFPIAITVTNPLFT
jgi:hypothetical protein